MLDEGISLHPLKEQRDSVSNWRQIGLGIFGLADMLIKMGIRYGSQEAIELCDRIGFVMANEAIQISAKLAREKGAYPKYKRDRIIRSSFYQKNSSEDTKDIVYDHGLRNSQLLTIAPTGTLSTMLGVSGGIEPIFENSYLRKTESLHGHDEYYTVYTPIVKEYLEEHGLKDETELPDYFVTAKELTYKERIDMQSVWQKHIDASISSTVNVPNNFTVEEVMELYMYAWKKNLKGVTIFREGCKRRAILTKIDDGSDTEKELGRGMIIKANDSCIGKKRTLHTGCGTLHCEAFFHPETGELLETYLSKGSTGGCNSFMVGLSRMISLSARGGINIYDIVDQLRSSVTCPSYAVRTATRHDTSKGSSCPAAVGRALVEMYEELCDELDVGTGVDAKDIATGKLRIDGSAEHTCPECGGEITFEGGCNTCKNCGWSKCD